MVSPFGCFRKLKLCNSQFILLLNSRLYYISTVFILFGVPTFVQFLRFIWYFSLLRRVINARKRCDGDTDLFFVSKPQ